MGNGNTITSASKIEYHTNVALYCTPFEVCTQTNSLSETAHSKIIEIPLQLTPLYVFHTYGTVNIINEKTAQVFPQQGQIAEIFAARGLVLGKEHE